MRLGDGEEGISFYNYMKSFKIGVKKAEFWIRWAHSEQESLKGSLALKKASETLQNGLNYVKENVDELKQKLAELESGKRFAIESLLPRPKESVVATNLLVKEEVRPKENVAPPPVALSPPVKKTRVSSPVRNPDSSLQGNDETIAEPSTEELQAINRREGSVKINGKRYRVHRKIGRGASSMVFMVTDANGEQYALKRVKLARLDQGIIDGYRDEIRLLESFKGSPEIVQLVEFEHHPTVIYLVREVSFLVDGVW